MIGLLLLILLGGLVGYVVRLDVFPGFTRNDFPNMVWPDSELFGNVERAFTSGNPLAYVENLATRQFGSMDSLPLDSGREWMVISALLCHVLHVVRVRAQKQMRGIHTGWIVAMVKYPKVIGNRAIVQLITKAMRANLTVVYVKHAVPIGSGGLPKPARLGLDHLRPKSLFWGIKVTKKVAWDIATGLTLDNSSFFTCYLGNGSRLAAATHAQSTRIGANSHRPAPVVSAKKTALPTRVLSCWKGLVATTFAEFDFVRGMITHVNSSFQLLTKAQGISRCRWALPIGVTTTPF